MNPIVMAVLLIIALAACAFSARRRWRLLMIGRAAAPGPKIDQLGTRVRRTLRIALGQQRMPRYRLAGLAHMAIFLGFLVLLLRSLILFARGFTDDPTFGYWLFDTGTALGNLYALTKDVFIILVILSVLVFLYYRVIVKLPRMTLSGEALLILAIILIMMIADITYDSANLVLAGDDSFHPWEPLGSIAARLIHPLPDGSIAFLQRAGFWTHVALVLIFLNILPYTKHFHVITAIPNVFCASLDPPGRLPPTDDIEGRVEREELLGVQRIDHLSWKSILDLYTCTECGRCSDQCPASRTGKLLSPKHFTIDLRNHLYGRQAELIAGGDSVCRGDLVPDVISSEALWACTSCRACEEECPVLISYVDTITDLRRHLVQERGEFPEPLQEAFRGMEAVGSPYGIAADERMKWAEGLDVPLRAETDEIDVLFWVGCAPAFDERAKGIARAVAQLLNHANVKWAVLGPQEMCTGDIARRAGNEFLFQAMARANIEILNGYGVTKILTACPHCYNTLRHEYPDFGGDYEVVHHAEFLGQLVAEGRLKPVNRVETTLTFHDSCYLGRYNEIYDAPRVLLHAIPGVMLVEAEASRDRGMCCGAGGGQMFKEEEPGRQRINIARTDQLIDTNANAISTACPFCMRMLTDGLADQGKADIEQLDIAELLWRSVRPSETPPPTPAS